MYKTLSSPCASSNYIYFRGTDNKLWRIDKGTGRNGVNLGGYKTSSSPFCYDDHIYFQGMDNKLWSIDYNGNNGVNLGGYKTSSTPCASISYIYFRGTDDKLWRIDRATGKNGVKLGGYKTSSSPFYYDDHIYFQGTDNKLWSIDYNGNNGVNIDGYETSSTPFYSDGYICFQGTDNKLWMLNYLNDLHEWMKKIPDTFNPIKMSIPGSHDSLAQYDELPVDWGYAKRTVVENYINLTGSHNYSKCQNNSIILQLNQGVRTLDIRLKNNDENLYAWHGDVDGGTNQKTLFSSAMNSCTEFLRTNPSEAIFMFIKKEVGDDISSLLEVAIQNTKSYWYLDNNNILSNEFPTKMSDIRGKIILLRRFEGVSYGVDFTSWKDNNKDFQINLSNSYEAKIQDLYTPSGDLSEARDNKFEAFCNMWTKSAQSEDKTIYLNFLSAVYLENVLTKGDVLPNTKVFASWLNDKISSRITDYSNYPIGIVMTDFVNSVLNSNIININFKKSK
jgi:1-phosphatidylinositol phosphodiesterase